MARSSNFRGRTLCQKLFRKKSKPEPTGVAKWKIILNDATEEMKKAIPLLDSELHNLEEEEAVLIATGELLKAQDMMLKIIELRRRLNFLDIGNIYSQNLARRADAVFADNQCPMDLVAAMAGLCYAADRYTEMTSLCEFKKEMLEKYGHRSSMMAIFHPAVTYEVRRSLEFPTPSPYQMHFLLVDIAVRYKVYEWEWFPQCLKPELTSISSNLYK